MPARSDADRVARSTTCPSRLAAQRQALWYRDVELVGGEVEVDPPLSPLDDQIRLRLRRLEPGLARESMWHSLFVLECDEIRVLDGPHHLAVGTHQLARDHVEPVVARVDHELLLATGRRQLHALVAV